MTARWPEAPACRRANSHLAGLRAACSRPSALQGCHPQAGPQDTVLWWGERSQGRCLSTAPPPASGEGPASPFLSFHTPHRGQRPAWPTDEPDCAAPRLLSLLCLQKPGQEEPERPIRESQHVTQSECFCNL